MQMLGRREGGGAPRDDAPRAERPSAAAPADKGGPAKKPAGKFDDMEDDIPF
jgi:hypothetical protein